MFSFDVCVLGHITKDIIKIGGIKKEQPGGVAYYTSIALRKLGLRVSVITKIALQDQYLLNELKKCGIVVYCRNSDYTTTFENIYEENLNLRTQKIRAIAQPLSMDDFPRFHSTMFHVGTMIKDDISLDLLESISKMQTTVSLGAQGLLLGIHDDKTKYIDFGKNKEILSCIDILFADEREIRMLSGIIDVVKAASSISIYGPGEVIITLGSYGSIIYSNRITYKIPSFPAKKIIDPTGCGDTYVAGYLFQKLISNNINRAGMFAAAMSTLKIESFGAFRGKIEEIESIVRIFGEK